MRRGWKERQPNIGWETLARLMSPVDEEGKLKVTGKALKHCMMKTKAAHHIDSSTSSLAAAMAVLPDATTTPPAMTPPATTANTTPPIETPPAATSSQAGIFNASAADISHGDDDSGVHFNFDDFGDWSTTHAVNTVISVEHRQSIRNIPTAHPDPSFAARGAQLLQIAQTIFFVQTTQSV